MVNGALVQLVMLPRVVYGLANLGLAPPWIGSVHPRTHTPVRATVIGAAVVGTLAVALDVAPLARLTSAVTLTIFVTINVALIAIKRQDGPTSTFEVPTLVPHLGIVASVLMLGTEVSRLAGWT